MAVTAPFPRKEPGFWVDLSYCREKFHGPRPWVKTLMLGKNSHTDVLTFVKTLVSPTLARGYSTEAG